MNREPLGGGGSGFELGGVRSCNWTLYFDPVESVGLSLSRAQNFAEQRFSDAVTVSGLGQDAYWQDSLDSLSVLSGPYTFTVLVWSETVDRKQAAVAVARLALSRLR